MTPEQLKASILQYAIQGKLVEQRAEEGNAEDLYQAIQKEKQRLIKEGKIKKEKPLAEITEDEIPFDIPDSWKWVRIPEIGLSSLGKTLNKGTDKGREVPYLCSINVYWDGIKLEQLKTAKFSDEDIGKYILKRNDLLVCEGGDIGRSAIWDRDEEMYYQNALHCIRFYGNTNPIYFKYCLQFYKLNGILDSVSKGMTIKHLVQGALYSIIFPLPPLDEQHRIVAKIEELLPFVDRYAAAYEKLEQFNAKFPEDMKKSILQYAIQGKLVEQRPEEGSAEDLYKQIQEEKQKLIKEGKIKKEKSIAKITEDEIPFDIPDNWKWCRLIDCVSILGDGIHGTPIYSADGEYCFINGNNLSDGIIEIKPDTKRVSFNEYEKYKKELNVHTVLVSINGTIGNVAFYSDEKVVLGKSACYFNLVDISLKKYIYWMLKTNYFLKYATTNATGSTIKNVSLTTMKSFLIPLPPLEEQHRIVAKIEELLPYCDQLIEKM